ncbi:MAG TPA: cupredoxin domain-containing protein [Solirubrobacterales bacterium]|jgi:iron uptake system component EfeO
MPRIPFRIPPIAAGVALIAALVAGCGSSEDAPAGAKRMTFTLTDAGCEPNTAKAPAGPIVFEVENAGTAEVTEFEVLDGDTVLGEVENLSEGLSGSFSLSLEQGEYTLYCPGGSDERGTLTVSGSSAAESSP